ncbi:MAG: hypothetical protein JNK50_10125 [Bacteroidia bacterium]|nr:hypothetical protein [Bacteroidia bacterium]
MYKLLTLIAVTAIGFGACNRNTDCGVKIKCKDQNGNNVDDAKVELYATVKNENNSSFIADMKASGVTDGNGESNFIFKLPAIYDVKVTSGTKTTKSIVKLEEGKTVTEEIIIQ